jgi:hypothetical protein
MSEAYTGGCACGAIRYEILGEPVVQNDCQCRDCQRISGTGHSSYLGFPDVNAMKVNGQPKFWDKNSDVESGGDPDNVKTRAFCPACGSPLYITFSNVPGFVAVHAASLDDPSRYKPELVTCSIQSYAWDYLDPALPVFEKMPPQTA